MTEDRIIAYLLNELNEAERERFEDECYANDEWPAEIGLAEESLVDDYLRGELTPAQRDNFAQHYLTTPAREEKLVNAKALLRHADERQQRGPMVEKVSWSESWRAFWSGWRVAFAALALVVLSVGVWWQVSAPKTAPTLVAITLQPGSITRDIDDIGPAPVRVTAPLPDALKVTLDLPPSASTARAFRLALKNIDKEEAVQTTQPQKEGNSVVVVIPSAQLARGQYEVKLYATNAAGEEQSPLKYYFSVN